MVIASFQLRIFVSFFIGDKCDAINSWLTYFKGDLHGDPKCFDVRGTLLGGT